MKKHCQRWLTAADMAALWLGLLSLRILLAWDYFESGLEKYNGSNWFSEIQEQFPFPFNLLPPDMSWNMATGFELVGGIALLFGLATRFFSISLIILTLVAMLSVHWPADWASWSELMQGYVFTDHGHGNFKLPVLFIGMLLPLALMGPGALSIDSAIRRWICGNTSSRQSPT